VAYVATSPSPSGAAHGAPLLWPGGVSALPAPREDAVVATNAEGVVTAWSAGTERLYGWPPEEAVGRRAGELLRPKVDRTSRATAERELRERGCRRGHLRAQHRQGAGIAVELLIIALPDRGTRAAGYVGVHGVSGVSVVVPSSGAAGTRPLRHLTHTEMANPPFEMRPRREARTA
jgi:PAS domain S-box-containing protein